MQIEFPDWMMEEPNTISAFQGFMAMRTHIKRPILTQYNFNRLIGQLNRLRDEGHPPEEVIRQSTERAWEGFYGLKADGPKEQKKSFGRRMMEATVQGAMDSERGDE